MYGRLITRADPEVVLVTSGILYAVTAISTAFVPAVRWMGRAPGATVGR
jgi:hypothetical protein